ncbi:MAG: pyridoxal-phosphate dependent enzyme [Fimbriimonadaceae bacterium]|nr:pyridoxal-phosphate dependent enzyme [Fimbriimonadaceae bacterium]QYK55642.1 MAG: pyridoxal-phosphate dependent enzyme [Fimbriimonadaceae bacterium]
MFARVPLCCLPTPCHPLPRLGAELGLDLWVKRDDLTGFAGGGNKGRKLEYLMAEAKAKGVQRVVCSGSLQSNFVRQIGAACSVLGIACTAVVMRLPYDAAFGPPVGPVPSTGGNQLLDLLFGVEIRRVPDGSWEQLAAAAEAAAREHEEAGEQVWLVPLGGSSALGAYAFAQAAREVGEDWDFVVVATSSGSTQAGLGWAWHGRRPHVIGVSADPEPDLADDIAAVAVSLDDLVGERKAMSVADFDVRRDWVGPGYNVPSGKGREAIKRLARTEGLLLDPVYTSKAFAALLDLAAANEVSGAVLFWHTGGLPVVFAQSDGAG